MSRVASMNTRRFSITDSQLPEHRSQINTAVGALSWTKFGRGKLRPADEHRATRDNPGRCAAKSTS